MSEYVEFYGDHVFLVQMIPNIAQISIFINFIKNRILHIFFVFLRMFKSFLRIFAYVVRIVQRIFTYCSIGHFFSTFIRLLHLSTLQSLQTL